MNFDNLRKNKKINKINMISSQTKINLVLNIFNLKRNKICLVKNKKL